ncbi:MAG: DUF4345 family protein [Hyphomicrobiales bacterium]|nr:DUF4345 family protein [Hyphomicrobiales bacterium]
MELSFPWPMSQGEWLAWISAAATVLLGVFFLFAGGTGLKALRLQTAPTYPQALAEVRGRVAGFYLGLGLSAILLAQPLIYMALGFSWAFTAFGRLVSMLSDGGGRLYNLVLLVVEVVLAALPLLFAFGLIA